MNDEINWNLAGFDHGMAMGDGRDSGGLNAR